MESLVEILIKRSSTDVTATSHQDLSDEDESVEAAQDSRDVECHTDSELPQSESITVHDVDLESQVTGRLDKLSNALLAAWPNQHDLDLILSVPVGVSVLFHGVVCMPYSAFFSRPIASPRHMLQLPPPGSHPVLIARRLLMLGALLKGIPPCSAGKLVGISSDHRAIMSHAVKTATRLVTSNDELVSSIEGIECVMIEAMYLNNAGNLRRAWLTNRRAMVIAQMMGLHTSNSSPKTMLEVDTRDRIDPDYMWFRVVSSDRYLSLMLGLPQGSLENVFSSPKAMKNCMAVEQMERMESVVGGLILQRNGTERTDLAVTSKIDKILQDTAALMPPQWWLISPRPSAIDGSDPEAFKEMIRVINQFTHYHLLVQLHLPYMTQPSFADAKYDYSKITAANASRAIITLFGSFRNSMLATAYCRGIDFIVFIASTALCLAHIEARRQHTTDSDKGINVFQSLQHQRLSDRGLLERTLEIMETVAQRSHDAVARKISSILRPLLAIENNSASGACYDASASSETYQEGSECVSGTGEALDMLCIQIPYSGIIKIEYRPTLSDTIELTQTIPEELFRNTSNSEATDTGPFVLCKPVSQLDREQDEEEQEELVSAALSAGYVISSAPPVNPDWQAVPSYFDLQDPLQQSGWADWDKNLSSLSSNSAQENHLLVPGLAVGIDNWALQGVDMALFNSLTQGSADPRCPDEETIPSFTSEEPMHHRSSYPFD
ncbi:MAG: hypothetical protein M1822_000167 [Bathelium mastoideum]|nr:MAG: hypothetical protein M1822_000167 [Bathelium mastoideum]